MAQAQLPSGAVLTVVDANGVILVHSLELQRWIGQALPDTPFAQSVLTRTEGTLEFTDLDGVTRLYGFSPFGFGEEHVIIGVPAATAYADVDRLTTGNLVTMGLVALLALDVAWAGGEIFFLRRMRALVSATERLASGDLTVRSGLGRGSDEMSQLARTFDQMAEALQQRDAERQRAEEAIRHQAARAEALARSAAHLNAQLDLETVLSSVCEEVARSLGTPVASVMLYDERSDTLFQAAEFGFPSEHPSRVLGQSLARVSMRSSGRWAPPSLCRTCKASKGLSTPTCMPRQTPAAQPSPVYGGVKILSAVWQSSPSAANVTLLTTSSALLQGLADQAALAIDNALCTSAGGQAGPRVDALNRVFYEALTCETDIEVAQACRRAAEELTGSQIGFVGELNEAGRLDTLSVSTSDWDTCRAPKCDEEFSAR